MVVVVVLAVLVVVVAVYMFTCSFVQELYSLPENSVVLGFL